MPNGGNRYFLADAFQVNTVLGTFGNSSRRFFHGPGIINTDFGMSKRIPITESMALEFRAEFFNIFNHTQFDNPSGNISSSRVRFSQQRALLRASDRLARSFTGSLRGPGRAGGEADPTRPAPELSLW